MLYLKFLFLQQFVDNLCFMVGDFWAVALAREATPLALRVVREISSFLFSDNILQSSLYKDLGTQVDDLLPLNKGTS